MENSVGFCSRNEKVKIETMPFHGIFLITSTDFYHDLRNLLMENSLIFQFIVHLSAVCLFSSAICLLLHVVCLLLAAVCLQFSVIYLLSLGVYLQFSAVCLHFSAVCLL